jgi:hypothetical protein
MSEAETNVDTIPAETVEDKSVSLGDVADELGTETQKSGDEAGKEVTEKPVDGDSSQTPKKDKDEEYTHDVRRMKTFMRRAFEAEAKLEAIQKQQPQNPNAQEQPVNQPQPTGRPVRDQFESYEDYQEALVDFKVDQRLSMHKQKETETSITKTFLQCEAEVKKEIADYDEVIAENSSMEIPGTVGAAMRESDLGPRLRYELAKNPELVAKLNAMTPIRAVVEFGKLEAKIQAEIDTKKKAPPVKISKAPEPITPVRSAGMQTGKKYEDMPMDEYVKARNEELRKAGKHT